MTKVKYEGKFFDPEETPKFSATDFVNLLITVTDEIYDMENGNFGSHKGFSTVTFYDQDGNYYKLKSVEPAMRPGCGCWDGLEIRMTMDADCVKDLQKEKEEAVQEGYDKGYAEGYDRGYSAGEDSAEYYRFNND